MALLTSKIVDRVASQPEHRSRGEEGYTLIEILVVLSIIALVMGLVGPRVLSYLTDSKVKAAKIQISNLTAALDLYYLDIGAYPNASEGLQALVQKPAGASNWNGPYLKSSLPNDPWGKPYLYRVPGEHGAYTILSLGADGQEGGSGANADISNDREQR
jgi:general secretion pathway protein G